MARLGSDNRFLQTRLMHDKLYAGLAFAKLNKIDKIIWDSPNPRLGIITTGKAYLACARPLTIWVYRRIWPATLASGSIKLGCRGC